MIQVTDIQNVKSLDVADRYKVLEFLVKEMMEIKDKQS